MDAATPGPWTIQENDDVWQLFGGEHGHMQILKAPKRGTDYAEYWPNEAEAHLIANAPTWLRSLLEENKRLNIALYTRESYDKTVTELHEENESFRSQLSDIKKSVEVAIDIMAWGDAENAVEKASNYLKSILTTTINESGE